MSTNEDTGEPASQRSTERRRRKRLLFSAAASVLAIGCLVFAAGRAFRMEHIIHLHSGYPTGTITIGVALDNDTSVYREAVVPAGGVAVIRFQKRAEAGYVFYQVGPDMREELGRCGYSDKKTNEYQVYVKPGLPVSCQETSSGWPYPLP